MAYIKNIWKDGETKLNAANLNRMEDGIASAVELTGQDKQDLDSLKGFARQLAGESNTSKFIIDYQTVDEQYIDAVTSNHSIYNIKNAKVGQGIEYGSVSTFSAVSAYIGQPISISQIKVPGKIATSDQATTPATKVWIKIYEMPNWEDIKNIWDDNKGILKTAVNTVFKLICNEEHSLDITLNKDKWQWVTIKLNETISNIEAKHLFMSYGFNTITGVTYVKINSFAVNEDTKEAAEKNRVNYPMQYNSWTYYGVHGKNQALDYTYQNKNYLNTSAFAILPVIIGHIDNTKVYYDIDTTVDGQFYKQVDKVINNMGGLPIPDDTKEAEVRLAKSYDLVVGDTFQLFFRGVIKCYGDFQRFGINCICQKGTFYPNYFEYTPTNEDATSYTLKIQIRDLNGKVINEGSTILNIHKVPVFNNKVVKNLCVFGDSLTSSGSWAAEGIRRLVGTSDSGFSGPASLKVANLTLNTYGHKTNTINTQVIHHEGYGGWTWQTFLKDSNTSSATDNALIVTTSTPHNYEIDAVQKSIWTDNNGLKWELEDLPSNTTIKFNRGEGNNKQASQVVMPTSMSCETLSLNTKITATEWESGNPFYNTITDEVDFKYWAKEVDSPGIDIAAVLLTWNAGGASGNDDGYTYQSKITTHINNAKTLLRQLHSDYPEAKVIVMGIQLSSLTGGTGANYGATGAYSDMWGTVFYAFDYNKALEKMCLETDFKSYCYYVDTKGQFDTINNMPMTDTAVNTRNTSITYKRGTNGVHPSTNGYYQIGDAFFRKLISILKED